MIFRRGALAPRPAEEGSPQPRSYLVANGDCERNIRDTIFRQPGVKWPSERRNADDFSQDSISMLALPNSVARTKSKALRSGFSRETDESKSESVEWPSEVVDDFVVVRMSNDVICSLTESLLTDVNNELDSILARLE